MKKKIWNVTLLTATVIGFGSLTEGTKGDLVFSIPEVGRFYQHQTTPANLKPRGLCAFTATYTMALSMDRELTPDHWDHAAGGADWLGRGISWEIEFKKRGICALDDNKMADRVIGPELLNIAQYGYKSRWVKFKHLDKLKEFGKKHKVVGAIAMVNAKNQKADKDRGQWWNVYHAVPVYEFNFKKSYAQFTDVDKGKNNESGVGNFYKGSDPEPRGNGLLEKFTWDKKGIIESNNLINGDEFAGMRLYYRAIPEPSSALLLGLGGLGLVFRRVRRTAGHARGNRLPPI